MCGFSIHLEDRPHRFDRLRERNYAEWECWMYRVSSWNLTLSKGVQWKSTTKREKENDKRRIDSG